MDLVSLRPDGSDIWLSATPDRSRSSIFQPLKDSTISLRPWATVHLAALCLLDVI